MRLDSPPPSDPTPRGGPSDSEAREMCARGEKGHCGVTTRAGCSDTFYRDQTEAGRCRLGCMIERVSLNIRGPRHLFRMSPKFARELVKSSLVREGYALRGMMEHAAFLREFYAPFVDSSPGIAGLEDCESPLPHLKPRGTFKRGETRTGDSSASGGRWVIVNWTIFTGFRARKIRRMDLPK